MHVFPWVVGISNMINPLHVEFLLKFLDVQYKYWQGAVGPTVLASIYSDRFGGLPETCLPHLDPEQSDTASDNVKGDESSKKKSRRSKAEAVQDYTDSESSAGDILKEEPRPPSSVCKTLTKRATITVTAASDGPPAAPRNTTVPRLTPSLMHQISAAPRGRVRGGRSAR